MCKECCHIVFKESESSVSWFQACPKVFFFFFIVHGWEGEGPRFEYQPYHHLAASPWAVSQPLYTLASSYKGETTTKGTSRAIVRVEITHVKCFVLRFWTLLIHKALEKTMIITTAFHRKRSRTIEETLKTFKGIYLFYYITEEKFIHGGALVSTLSELPWGINLL